MGPFSFYGHRKGHSGLYSANDTQTLDCLADARDAEAFIRSLGSIRITGQGFRSSVYAGE